MNRLIPIMLALLTSLPAQDSAAVAMKSPRQAVIYSLFPGGGQLYNGKELKAALMLGAQLWMLYQFQVNRLAYNNWENGSYPLAREAYRDDRNKFAWYSAFVYIYNLADALVDSHLADFDAAEDVDDTEQTVKGTDDG